MPLFKDQDSGVEKIFEGLPKNVKEELGGFSKIDLLDLNKDDCINICESKAQSLHKLSCNRKLNRFKKL